MRPVDRQKEKLMVDNESMLYKTLSNLDSKFDKLDEKVDKLTVISGKQELLMEKIMNTDNMIEQIKKVAHKRIDDLSNKIDSIHEMQTKTGCTVFQSHYAQRKEQLKAYDKEVDIAKTERKELRQDIEHIKELPNEIMFKVFVSLITAGLLGLVVFYIEKH